MTKKTKPTPQRSNDRFSGGVCQGYYIAREDRKGKFTLYTGVDDGGQRRRWTKSLVLAQGFIETDTASEFAESLCRYITDKETLHVVELALNFFPLKHGLSFEKPEGVNRTPLPAKLRERAEKHDSDTYLPTNSQMLTIGPW